VIRIFLVSNTNVSESRPGLSGLVQSGVGQSRLASLGVISLAMLLGVVWLHMQPVLQTAHSMGPLWTDSQWLMLLPVCLLLFYYSPGYRIPLAFLSGYLWALLFAQLYLQHQLPSDWTGKDVLLEGVVIGLPDMGDASVRFDFQVSRYFEKNGSPCTISISTLPTRLRLSWYYHKDKIHTGQHWRLKVRLKPPHGMQNPGGFDYEKWLYQQGIHASGYVRKSSENQPAGDINYGVDRLRENLQTLISRMPDQQYTGLLQALTIGSKSLITSQQWQILRQTGTSHLMAISGLHIGLVAGLVFLMVRRIVPAYLCRISTAPQVAAVICLLAAGFYALLAGFTVSTQRAFIMLLVLMLAILIKRPAFSLNTLSLALIAVLLINPTSVLSVGFWLSFLAVLIISLVTSARVSGSTGKLNNWIQGVRIQWLIALGMLPLSVMLFQQGSLISPVANMIAIPLVGLIIVPLALFASLMSLFSTGLSLQLFNLISELLSLVWVILEYLASVPYGSWNHSSVPLLQLLLGLSGALLLLMPGGVPLRYTGVILILPMLLYRYPRPSEGDFWVDVIDVGQGLSVLVQTTDKTLLYDTGAKFSSRFDIGQRVVVPYLNYIGLNKLDVLMISHADNDHAGGANSIMQLMPVEQFISNANYLHENTPTAKSVTRCKAGSSWKWNGVNFEVLHPQKDYKKSNNRSCVLKIWNQQYSVLLTGDIEKKVERNMLSQISDKLPADVLIVPHHGSNTSSTQTWLKKVDPQLAIVSAGYKNRFGHPSEKVMIRYQQINSRLINTATAGMIQIKLPSISGESIKEPRLQRKVSTHYWNHRLR
jgi:competence protein ComEC